MHETEARLILAELVPVADWDAFTDWLEEGEASCSHEPADYVPWLGSHGVPNPDRAAAKLYEAMGILAGGPCRCAAAAEVWPSDFHAMLRIPIVYAIPTTLPRALTGLPETLSSDEQSVYTRFFGARRGRASLGTFWNDNPEPDIPGDPKAGMRFAHLMAEIVAGEPSQSWLAANAMGAIGYFFHSGDPAVVEAWFRDHGHELVPFERILAALTIIAVQDPYGRPARRVEISLDGSLLSAGYHETRPDLVVIRPTTGQVWADGAWRTVSPEARLSTAHGEVPVGELSPGVHAVRVGVGPQGLPSYEVALANLRQLAEQRASQLDVGGAPPDEVARLRDLGPHAQDLARLHERLGPTQSEVEVALHYLGTPLLSIPRAFAHRQEMNTLVAQGHLPAGSWKPSWFPVFGGPMSGTTHCVDLETGALIAWDESGSYTDEAPSLSEWIRFLGARAERNELIWNSDDVGLTW